MRTIQRQIIIGIPAFNEEKNIGNLLDQLNNQILKPDCHVKKIIISSDASSDNTDQIVRDRKEKNIFLITNKIRQGQAEMQNMIIAKSDCDALVLLNADIKIDDPYFIQKLVDPVLNKSCDLVSSAMLGVGSNSLVGKTLDFSLKIKYDMFSKYRQGNNIYSCHGAARCLSKKLYKSFKFSKSVGEDAYLFLYVKKHGMRFTLVNDAIAYIKSPESLTDHLKQSIRNISNQKILKSQLGEEIVKSEYSGSDLLFGMPILHLMPFVVKYFFLSPVYSTLYAIISLLVMINPAKISNSQNTWNISSSSKSLDVNNLSFLSKSRSLLVRMLGYIDSKLGIEEPNIIVLAYHGFSENKKNKYHISTNEFIEQIEYLTKTRQPIRLSELPKFTKNNKKKLFAICFDDGYKSTLKIKDYLDKKNICPTLFILSQPHSINRRVLGNEDELLNISDIAEIANSWEIGSHTRTHQQLTKIPLKKQMEEVVISKSEIERIINKEVTAFSYPQGLYDSKVLELVKKSKYTLAVTMDDGFITNKTNLLALPRIGVDSTHRLDEFKYLFSPSVIKLRRLLKVFGLHYLYK